MSLSNDLVSQFVKITKDDKKTKSETTVYGTAVKYNGSMYVRIDGSDLLTPISSTVDAKDGERVTVMIKNHNATITGNVSSPAARTDDVQGVGTSVETLNAKVASVESVLTEDLKAESARIDSLVAENVVIKESLTASEADIDTLQANSLTVNEKLSAAEADITTLKTTKLDATNADLKYATIASLEATDAKVHNLESTYGDFVELTADNFEAVNATITNLDSKYATITDLNAAKGDIDVLESDVATIDTLIFGAAGGNVIQTSFSNAVIAQLGDAQIKSAMIESISADKITAGDIITNNMRVKSSDGNLVISDETMQISDGTRVRVQIGKDASGDYSINVWDGDGNLMFSEGGITGDAIKDAIIRDDMVSDTANIAAHKLDIDSLFEEINGSTKTIKSTKVYLDEEGQSLDVAFKTLSTETGDLQKTVSSQGTQLTAVQGQISSKVWKQDITTAINNIDIGSRNYFIRNNINTLAWGGSNDEFPHGYIIQRDWYRGYSFPVAEGEQYTIYRTEATNNRWGVYWFAEEPAHNVGGIGSAFRSDDQEAGVVNYVTVPTGANWGFIYLSNDISAGEIPNIMLEKGNKATDWSPAPEDVDNDISSLSTQYSTLEQTLDGISTTVASHTNEMSSLGNRVSSAESNISQHATDISSLVSRTEVVENKFDNYSTTAQMNSAINQKADSITSAVSTTYATKSALNTTDTKASNAATAAANAQSDIDNLAIGGRNYFRPSMVVDLGCTGGGSVTQTLISTGTCVGFYIPVTAGEVWSVSRGSLNNTRFDYCFTIDKPANGVVIYGWSQAYRNELKIEGIVVPEGYNYMFFYLSNTNETVDNLKIEKGSRATDWTPAPEDIEDRVESAESSITQLSDRITSNVSETTALGTRMSTVEQTASGLTARLNTAETNITNAAKTATNYLNYSSGGLVVGDMTASTLGKNVCIDSDSVDIRNGSTVLASFKGDEITLGQNAEGSAINLCDGAGKISAQTSEASTSYPEYDSILIEAQEINTASQRFVTDVTNSYNATSTPTYQNDGEIYMLSYPSSAGSYARMTGHCKTTSSGDMTQTGVSAAALDKASTTNTSVYAEFWDESAGSWTQSNQVKVYPTKTTASKPIWIQGTEFTGENKVLWSGGYYMSNTQTATLSEAISSQANGVVLVWSYYTDGASDNSNFHFSFVPKHFVSAHTGKGHAMFMTNASLSVVAGKYVYISDTKITGYANNIANAAAKESGLTASPKYFVLRYVIGV